MYMQPLKLRGFWLAILATFLTLALVLFSIGRLNAPESSSKKSLNFKDGDFISLRGELVCLQHRDVKPGQPVTTECAFGFRDESGIYYAVKDTSEDYSLVGSTHMYEPVHLEGTYRANTDMKYDQSGSIEVVALTKQ